MKAANTIATKLARRPTCSQAVRLNSFSTMSLSAYLPCVEQTATLSYDRMYRGSKDSISLVSSCSNKLQHSSIHNPSSVVPSAAEAFGFEFQPKEAALLAKTDSFDFIDKILLLISHGETAECDVREEGSMNVSLTGKVRKMN